MQPIHEHNSFYLTEERKDQAREYFKFLTEQASESLAAPSVRVLDTGCATGDFLYYLRSRYPQALLSGTDVVPEFVARAKQTIPDATFFVADIYSGTNLPTDLFDVVFMSGVNYLFSEYEPYIRNIIRLTRKRAYIFGIFNPEDLDVRAEIQRSGDKTSAISWNLISRKSISLFLDHLRVKHRFINWELPVANPRRQDDPTRSWTIETKDGSFLVVNGTQFIQRFAVLQIDVAH